MTNFLNMEVAELPVADEDCTMIYPLVKDLSAYRVVER